MRKPLRFAADFFAMWVLTNVVVNFAVTTILKSEEYDVLQSISGHFSKRGCQVCFEYS